MRVVDTKGQSCPVPLIAVKKVLKEIALGESFMVLTDNQTSFENLCRFLKDNNTDFQVSEKGKVWTLTITKNAEVSVHTKTNEYGNSSITHFQRGNFIIVFDSEKMGEGDDELGLLLMNNFIKAVKDLDKLPEKIIFYNKGVELAANDSPVIDHLKDLEKMGVELLLCATCVNHYSLETSVSIGTLSNMFTIAEVMASSGNIIKP